MRESASSSSIWLVPLTGRNGENRRMAEEKDNPRKDLYIMLGAHKSSGAFMHKS